VYKDKKILVITSRSFYKDYRVLKSIYNLFNFSQNISLVQLLKSNETIKKNNTIFNLNIHSIKPYYKSSINKEKKYSNKIKNFKKNENFF
jgi:hypothetical protein